MRGFRAWRSYRLAVAVAAVALAGAACGANDMGTSSGASGQGDSGVVQVQTVEGIGEVLTDAAGMALYTSDVERDGQVRCTGACAENWPPLLLPDGQTEAPAGPDGLSGQIGLIDRPSGEGKQLTLDGVPLYTFAFDDAGMVTGNGLGDSFEGVADGAKFTWSVVTLSGAGATTTAPAGDGGYGGY